MGRVCERESASERVHEGRAVRRRAGGMKASGHEMREEVKRNGKLSVHVEQKVNNDGMISPSPHNQPLFHLLLCELYIKVSNKR